MKGMKWWTCGLCGLELRGIKQDDHLERAHNMTAEAVEKVMNGICPDCNRNHRLDPDPLAHISDIDIEAGVNRLLADLMNGANQVTDDTDWPGQYL